MLEIWRNPMLTEQQALLPKNPVDFSDTSMQSRFNLPPGTQIIFTDDKKTLKPVVYYNDLPEVFLTREEQEIVWNISQEILSRKSAFNYDGDHLLLSGVLYDPQNNTLYIEAKKAKYSLLTALNGKKFPEESPIYKQDLYGAGCYVPLITKDGNTLLLQSSKYGGKNFLTVAGFVQAKDSNTKLLDTEGSNLVEKTAHEELLEEILWGKEQNSRIDLLAPIELSSVCFRKPLGGRGFVEFIAPVKLDCTHERLIHVVRTNQAPDGREHTGVFKLINLNPDYRSQDYETWSKNTPGGSDLYPAILSEASRIFNREEYKQSYGDVTYMMMPVYRGKAFPMSFLRQTLMEIKVYFHRLKNCVMTKLLILILIKPKLSQGWEINPFKID